MINRVTRLLEEIDLDTIAISIAAIAMLLVIRWIVVRLAIGRIKDLDVRVLWRQILSYILIVIGLGILVNLWFDGGFGELLTGLALIATALIIVNKELIQNVGSYGVIVWRSLFSPGEFVSVGDSAGRVIDIGPLFITLRESSRPGYGDLSSGRQIKVPNAMVLTNPVVNYTRNRERFVNVLGFKLPAGTNVEKCEAFLIEAALDALPGVDAKPDSMEVFLSVEDHGPVISLRYLCEPTDRARTEDAILRRIAKDAFEHGLFPA